MIPVPEEQLQALRCHKCSGILSSGPVMASQEGSQLCGVCTKLLSPQAQTGLVRQVAYEALARLMSFPCRYGGLHEDSPDRDGGGCTARLAWNAAPEHEAICPYRNRKNSSTPSLVSVATSVSDLHSSLGDDDTIDVLVELDDDDDDYESVSGLGDCEEEVLLRNDKTKNVDKDSATSPNKTALNYLENNGVASGEKEKFAKTQLSIPSKVDEDNNNRSDKLVNENLSDEGGNRHPGGRLRESYFLYENFCPVYDYIVKKDLAYFIPSNDLLNVEIWFDLNQQRNGDGGGIKELEQTLFKYRIEIQGNRKNGSRLTLASETDAAPDAGSGSNRHSRSNPSPGPIKIVMDGRVTAPTAGTRPARNISCDVQVHSLKNPTPGRREGAKRQSINPDSALCCLNCQKVIDMAIYQCKHGHVMCVNCRTDRCHYCTQEVNSSPLYVCKFLSRGCKSTFGSSNKSLHEVDCEYGFHRCPLESVRRCTDVEGTLALIRTHLHEAHPQDIKSDNEIITKGIQKDDCWIILSHDSIFRCRYWCTDAGVEFVVQYVGAQHRAKEYKYEVGILDPDNPDKCKSLGSAVCLGKNEVNLEKGTAISKRKLEKFTNADGMVSYKMRIL